MEAYDRHTPYNQLPPLPPDQALYMDAEVGAKLVLASRRLAELKGLAATLPNQTIFVNTIALREAKASSAIENIFTTDYELYRSLSYQEDDYLEGPAKEILHYREALWKGFQDITKEKNLSVETVVNVFRQVKKTHEGIYTPPRGKGVVEKKMADWIDFLNDDSAYPVDPLLKMTMAHYQFEAIHPFRDGNGRTGRILCIIYLIQKGLLDLPILYLSAYILQNKDAYYYALNSVTGLRDWKAWILYMLEAVSQTSEYTIDKINRIRSLMEKTERIIRENKLSLARLNLSKLFEQPYIRPKNLLSNTIKSVNTAKKYLGQLEGLGLLTKERIGKEYIWFNTELMAILSD